MKRNKFYKYFIVLLFFCSDFSLDILFAEEPIIVKDNFELNVDFEFVSDKNNSFGGIRICENKNGKIDLNDRVDFYIKLENGEYKIYLTKYLEGEIESNSFYKEAEFYKPYKISPVGRLRIVRDETGGCLHFYHQYKTIIDGKECKGWKESETIDDKNENEFYVFLFDSSEGESPVIEFSNFTIKQNPVFDQLDLTTGFKATKRDYTFSGHTSSAIVITFDEKFEGYDKDIKFVFWEDANYIPWWDIDKETALTYEFLECWGGGTVGCCEPMSDRICRWSNVEILESNKVRVVVHWGYLLCDMNYDFWGGEKTYADEYYYFYPDGIGIREAILKPVGIHSHEVGELILINAGGSKTSKKVDEFPLTVFNLEKDLINYKWDLEGEGNIIPPFSNDIEYWPEIISRINLKDRLDPFMCISQRKKNREKTWPTSPPLISIYEGKGEGDFTNELICYAHWPISKRPYENPITIPARFLREPSHTSFINFGAGSEPFGKTSWCMLIGVTDKPNDYIKEVCASWVNPAKIFIKSKGIEYNDYIYSQRAYKFSILNQSERNFSFSLQPQHLVNVINPVFIISNWQENNEINIKYNDELLSNEEYTSAIVDSNLIIWLNKKIDKETTFEIIKKL